jgi:ADP-heptose:LPS heptosyltransferase
MNDISIGMAFENPNRLCNSVGDTLCISAILEKLSEEKGDKLIMCALPQLYDLWLNNPYLKSINSNTNPTINMIPCRQVPCNIVRYYTKQLNLTIPEPIKPRIYLTPEEIEWGKNQVREFDGYKKIVICPETGVDGKNLRPEYIAPLLNRLKENGYKLIRVGVGFRDTYGGYNKSFYNRTTLRQAFCIMNACDLFLGIDCGLSHAAAALDVPQVMFFRNNLSSNNKYHDTFYIDSNIKCQGNCLNHIAYCQGLARCMDSFDLNQYFNLINKCIDVGKHNIEASIGCDVFKTCENGIY